MTDEPTKLFVYGIFLDESHRLSYNMTNPRYATVLDYATFGHSIVQAQHIPEAGLSLTGLLVDYDPTRWRGLDNLEGGYDRVIVTTTSGVDAYMYVTPQAVLHNHSTYVPAALRR